MPGGEERAGEYRGEQQRHARGRRHDRHDYITVDAGVLWAVAKMYVYVSFSFAGVWLEE
jgi:hypothetical protein